MVSTFVTILMCKSMVDRLIESMVDRDRLVVLMCKSVVEWVVD